MTLAEFEKYAKEHNIFYCTKELGEQIKVETPPILEQIRAEIEQIKPYDLPWDKRTPEHIRDMAVEIVEKYADQEPKTGHWVEIDEEPHEVWECDHCGFVIDGSGCIDPYDYRDTYKFCPNCGARMVEPQESEDKE